MKHFKRKPVTDEYRLKKSKIALNRDKNLDEYQGSCKDSKLWKDGRYNGFVNKSAWKEYIKKYKENHRSHKITLTREFEEEFITMFRNLYGFDLNFSDYIKINLENKYKDMKSKLGINTFLDETNKTTVINK